MIHLSTDNILSATIGNQFSIVKNALLGKGSYGNVYLATDEYNNQLAIKSIPLNKTGIPGLMEANIMMTLDHPNLNKAYKILALNEKLYIVQKVAKCDLTKCTRKEKIPIDTLRIWMHSIAQAVSVLHAENIIHADIKASNVLLFADGEVKLTDFTLARYCGKQKHNACTSTHRPPENCLGLEWDKSLDIWSLGCTFYELAYSKLLFPSQRIEGNDGTNVRMINCITDWAKDNGLEYDWSVSDDSFVKAGGWNADLGVINELILGCLQPKKEKRWTIDDVLKHPFFTGLSNVSYKKLYRPVRKLSSPENARISRYLEQYTEVENIKRESLILYSKCADLSHIAENLRVATCVWIITKLLTGKRPILLTPKTKNINCLKIDHHKYEIQATEREICSNLWFRLI